MHNPNLDIAPYPDHIGIEVSNVCNCKCVICPLFQGEEPMNRHLRKNRFMSMEVFSKIIDEITRMDCQIKPTIFLNIFGEPLLDPTLPQKLELLNKNGLAKNIYLQTNATMLKGNIALDILKHEVGWLVPCLDSCNARTFEAIRVGANFEDVIANIENFTNLRNRMDAKTNIALQHVRTSTNTSDHKNVYERMQNVMRKGDLLNITTSHYWATKSLKNHFGALVKTGYKQINFECPVLLSWINIDVDGNALTCYFDYNFENYPSGEYVENIMNNSLMEIWENKYYANLRSNIKNGCLPPRCAQCSMLFADPTIHRHEIFDYPAEQCIPGDHAVIVKFV